MGPRNRGESIHTYVLLVYILFVFGTYSCNYSFQPIPTSLCFWVFRNPTPKPGPILSSRQIHTCCSPLPNFRRARCETSIASLPLRQLAVIQKQSDQQNPVFATATWKKNHPQCHMPYSNRRAQVQSCAKEHGFHQWFRAARNTSAVVCHMLCSQKWR